MDEIIVFHALDEEHIKQIASLMLESVAKRLAEKEIFLETTEAARIYMATQGFDAVYGARPLRRFIQKTVEDKLSEEILGGRISIGDKVLLDMEDDKPIFKKPQ